MIMEKDNILLYKEPFPHLVAYDFYNQEELDLIWEELNFYTKPGKFLSAENFAGIVGYTNSHGLILDDVYAGDYKDYRNLSNILTVNRKIFESDILDEYSNLEDCVCLANKSNWNITKVRYYQDGEYYKPHTDKPMQFLAFSYFYKEPKKFTGGELEFPKYDYTFNCKNNSLIIFPGWVEHGVKIVSMQDSDHFDGYGRYAITTFFGCRG